MKMKTYLFVGVLWFCILTISVSSKSENINYAIQFDSESSQTLEIKNEVLKRYSDLVRGVHEQSVLSLVLHNLDQFMWEDTMQADYKNSVLEIIIGDGDGFLVEGELEANSICFPEVKPKSFLAELFQ